MASEDDKVTSLVECPIEVRRTPADSSGVVISRAVVGLASGKLVGLSVVLDGEDEGHVKLTMDRAIDTPLSLGAVVSSCTVHNARFLVGGGKSGEIAVFDAEALFDL